MVVLIKDNNTIDNEGMLAISTAENIPLLKVLNLGTCKNYNSQ